MFRRVFAWCLPLILFVVCSPGLARAERRVCVKPPGVSPQVDRWAYRVGSRAVLLTESPAQFAKESHGLVVYVYDPYAPPESAQSLPIPHNTLRCPKPPPRPKPPPAKEAKKASPEEEQKAAAPAQASEEAKPKPSPPQEPRDEQGDVIPPGVKKMPERPPTSPKPSPPPPEGVLSSEPLLPPTSTLPKRDEVQPPKCVDEQCTMVDRGGALPVLQHRQGRPLVSAVPCGQTKEGCEGEGEGSGDEKEEETNFDALAQQLALAAGLADDPSHDLHRKDGKKHGIVGGEDADGFNHPALQAAVAFLQLSALARAQVKAFDAKMKEAARKNLPIVINGAKELSDDAIAYLRKKYGKKRLAGTLADMQVIGPYETMSKFTENLEGIYEAHHILEEAMARKLGITKELDKIPAVILENAEHKRFSGRLRDARKVLEEEGVTLNPRELWGIYKDVYAKHPAWLEAIKPYFGGK